MSSVGSSRVLGSGPTMAEIAQSLIATTAPANESTTPVIGNTLKAQAADHQHARLTSATYVTITSGSTATAMFTYKSSDGTLGFIKSPTVDLSEIEGDTTATSQPGIFKVQSWVRDPVTNRYTGAVIKAWRAQTVPTTLATLLLSGVFNLFATSVVGTQISVIALARSD